MTLIDIEPLLAEGWIFARTAPSRYGKTTQAMRLTRVAVVEITGAVSKDCPQCGAQMMGGRAHDKGELWDDVAGEIDF